MVTIATFNEPAKAKQLKKRFQEAGVKADVHNEAQSATGRLHVEAAGQRQSAWWRTRISRRAQGLMVEWEATDPDIAAAHSLPAMQFIADRISATDAQIYHPGAGRHSFRAEDFSQGILLPGLPFHLEQ